MGMQLLYLPGELFFFFNYEMSFNSIFNSTLLLLLLFFVFLGPHPWHMEVPRLAVESELLLLAYTTATATPHQRSEASL